MKLLARHKKNTSQDKDQITSEYSHFKFVDLALIVFLLIEDDNCKWNNESNSVNS